LASVVGSWIPNIWRTAYKSCIVDGLVTLELDLALEFAGSDIVTVDGSNQAIRHQDRIGQDAVADNPHHDYDDDQCNDADDTLLAANYFQVSEVFLINMFLVWHGISHNDAGHGELFHAPVWVSLSLPYTTHIG